MSLPEMGPQLKLPINVTNYYEPHHQDLRCLQNSAILHLWCLNKELRKWHCLPYVQCIQTLQRTMESDQQRLINIGQCA